MSIESSNTAQACGVRRTWDERLDDAARRFDALAPALSQKRCVFVVDSASEALEALVYGRDRELDFGILEASRVSEAVACRLDELGIARVEAGTGAVAGLKGAEARQPGRVSVMTSGTTGMLKPIAHTWQTLNTLERVKNDKPRTWFVPYQPGSYAWYQMMCLSLFRPGQHVHCGSPEDAVESFRAALDEGITAVSSTPTFWRCVLLSIDEAALRASRIETISLGGEIVDQAILDQLAAIFPGAGVRHIYASSEAGAAIVVTDGKAGFPVSRLEQEGVGLRVEGGRLYVRSSYTTAAASGEADAWVDTGDLVEVRDARVYFLGREGATMINVGGMKAYAAEIEGQLLRHPGVRWAQVYARRAPLVGSLPAARIVLRDAVIDSRRAEEELAAFARKHLPEHAVPRSWTFLDEIPLQPSLKS